ncbi:hypothetical protein [Bradyrhizobium sp. SZCCHNS1022]|nr:hypothetical protein [Bradyrhizobium sp. SZCCHNS1022]
MSRVVDVIDIKDPKMDSGLYAVPVETSDGLIILRFDLASAANLLARLTAGKVQLEAANRARG